jgi:hypothetical protein
MKEVKKSPKKLAAYINRTVGQAMKSPKGIYHRKKLHHLFENACYRKKKQFHRLVLFQNSSESPEGESKPQCQGYYSGMAAGCW